MNMLIEELIQLLAEGAKIRWDDGQCNVVKFYGTACNIEQLIQEGWIVSGTGSSYYKLSDDGLKAFLKSTDEMGDGKLISPIEWSKK